MLNPELVKEYRKAKKSNFSPYGDRKEFATTSYSAMWQARHAMRAKETKRQWEKLGGYVFNGDDRQRNHAPEDQLDNGVVRLVIKPDDFTSLDDLLGDAYEPKHNPDIKPEILESERAHQIDRINNDGVWYVVSEVWNGDDWEWCDSCGGFIGDDWENSGYDVDLMQSAIDRLKEINAENARKLEESRPDMYQAC